MFEIIPKSFYYDFIARRHFWANISWAACGLAIAVFFIIGPNWSIDFTGGTEVQVHFEKDTTVSEVREALKPLGISDDAIQQIDDASQNRFLFRVQGASSANPEDVDAVKSALTSKFGQDWITNFTMDAEVGTRASVTYKGEARQLPDISSALAGLPNVQVQSSPDENTFYVRLPGVAEQVRGGLTKALGDRDIKIERTDSVGPKVGGNLRLSALLSMGITLALMLAYIAFRFDFTFAPGAVICLFHDSCILVGIWVVTHQEFGLSMISAILTLMGYSMNDTIVVYDRIRENMEKYRSKDFEKLINDSINQTLSRTIMTSVGTAMSLVPFLFFGGPILFHFAEAMLIGILVGTYSSIYVAAPLTIVLRENRAFFSKLFGGLMKPAGATSTAVAKAEKKPTAPKAP